MNLLLKLRSPAFKVWIRHTNPTVAAVPVNSMFHAFGSGKLVFFCKQSWRTSMMFMEQACQLKMKSSGWCIRTDLKQELIVSGFSPWILKPVNFRFRDAAEHTTKPEKLSSERFMRHVFIFCTGGSFQGSSWWSCQSSVGDQDFSSGTQVTQNNSGLSWLHSALKDLLQSECIFVFFCIFCIFYRSAPLVLFSASIVQLFVYYFIVKQRCIFTFK